MKLHETVPEFSLPATGNKEISLSSLRGKKVLLYFYPKDNTPGCTLESQQFSGLYPEFKKLGVEIFGISRDSLKSHDNFRGKFDLQFDLLSDSEEKLCQLFDVIKEKNMYGKMVLGIERSTFIIDEDGKLVGEFRKIKADGHAQAMLEFVKSL